ncbi:MAG: PD-(D/E)XK nuclease family protein [Bdellovibrionia bacterium]
MLKVTKVEKRHLIQEIIKDFDPNQTCWVVSDLRTKFEIQTFLLQKYGFFQDESVLRASDLWKLLLRRRYPQIKVVSEAFLRTVLRHYLDENSEMLQGIDSGSEKTLMAYLDHMAGILLHPNGLESMREWFEQNPQSAQRWQNWFLRAQLAMNYLIQQQKIISPKWVASFLQNELNLHGVWQRNLIVDLGAEITSGEAEVFKLLSQAIDIEILKPSPPWQNKFKYLLHPYKKVEEGSVSRSLKLIQEDKKHSEVHRLSSALAEVKWAVAKTSEWIAQDVEPSKIAIIAPDIEHYWPVLKSFLDVQGVIAQKNMSTKFQSFGSINNWLAQLRVRTGLPNSTDLELATYSQPTSAMKYEKFKALFAQIYSPEDLKRDQKIEKYFSSEIQAYEKLNAREFLVKALFFWNGEVTEVLEKVFKEVLSNSSVQIRLRWSQWLKYLETICAQKEEVLYYEERTGVQCVKLQSAGSFGYSHRIFLGLADENLKVPSSMQLTQDEYFLVQKDLDFTIENPDISCLDFDLRYITEAQSEQDCYLFANTDFEGRILSPSAFWLEQEKATGLVLFAETSLETAWDLRQKQTPYKNKRVLEDLNLSNYGKVPFLGQKKLSPSSLDDYFKCPFIFAAKRVFNLEDHAEIDLDLDPRTYGTLAHALFDALVKEPFTSDYSEEEICAVLDTVKAEEKLIFADERLWASLRTQFLNLALKFLKAEKARREALGNSFHTLHKELSVQFYYNPLTRQVSKNSESSEDWQINCRIDRVDSDGNYLAIIDYKSSVASAPPVTSWIKQRKLQMLLYLWAFEANEDLSAGQEVVALFYYIFKNFSLKGYQANEVAGTLFGPPKKKSKENTLAHKIDLLADFKKLLDEAMIRIQVGDFAPKPLKEETCKTCQWRQICRAPHLM